MLRRRHVAGICLMLLASSTFAASSQERDGDGTTVIRAGRLFDSESGVFLPARDIVVRGEAVIDVRPQGTAPPGARVIDLRQYTVIPGLIDSHTHLLTWRSVAQEDAGSVEVDEPALRVLRAASRARTYLFE